MDRKNENGDTKMTPEERQAAIQELESEIADAKRVASALLDHYDLRDRK